MSDVHFVTSRTIRSDGTRTLSLRYRISATKFYDFTRATLYAGHVSFTKGTILEIMNDALACGIIKLSDIEAVADALDTATKMEDQLKLLRSSLSSKPARRGRKKPAEPPSSR